MNKKPLFSIFLIVFIDLLGFGLILPLLPYYADEYGATPFVIGLLTASYAAAQLVGAPVLGRLSDRYGRRPVLLVSILGTAVGFLILGVADPLGRGLAASLGASAEPVIIAMLFFSRVLDGATGGNISVAQAYITDVTDSESRARGLGLVGAAFGLGFIVGPAAGGILSSWGFAVPAYVAAVLASLNMTAVYLWLPESLTIEQRLNASNQERSKFSAKALWHAISRVRVGPLLHIRFFFGMAFSIFQTIFPLFALYKLALAPRETGFILAYVGILAALVQGVAIGQLTKRFSERGLILSSSIIMSVSLLAWALTPNVPVLLIILLPLAYASGVLGTVINSALTKAVYPEEVGGTLGLAASLESGTRVIAPSLGGYLLGAIGTWAPGIISAAIMAYVGTFTWRRLFLKPDPPLFSRETDQEPGDLEIPVPSH